MSSAHHRARRDRPAIHEPSSNLPSTFPKPSSNLPRPFQVDELVEAFRAEHEDLSIDQGRLSMLSKGVASHHAGICCRWRRLSSS